MKIALFSTFEEYGGAARASARLYNGLKQDSRISGVKCFVKSTTKTNATAEVLPVRNKYMDEIQNTINNNYIPEHRTPFSDTFFSSSISDTQLSDLTDFDVINLHWVETFLGTSNLNELLQSGCPVVWTLHDMKPFTGGCHYSAGCNEFVQTCSNCPQLIKEVFNLPEIALGLKLDALSHSNLTIVTPSHWLAEQARKSALFKHQRIEVIPNGIDVNVFMPVNKKTAKKQLGIDEDTLVLAFGVDNGGERRKGFKELYQSILLLKKRELPFKIVAVFFGDFNDDFPIEVAISERVESDSRLSLIYSAADIYVLPSLEDNFPNVLLESLACETPVIAFDTGGAGDIICDDNGKIVPKGDTNALADAIYEMLSDSSSRLQKGRNGRERVVNNYQNKHCASAYISLFESLQASRSDSKAVPSDNSSALDPFIGYIARHYCTNTAYLGNFTRTCQQLEQTIAGFRESNKKYALYGYGTIGQLIAALMPDNIVGYVDISDPVHQPENLKQMNFDFIIITVLGKEREITKYLGEHLKIDRKAIISLHIL